MIYGDFATFGSISGLVVNYTDSKAFYLSSLRGNVTKPLSEKGLQWLSEDDNLKYLGFTIPIKRSVDNQTVLRVNFENSLAQINIVLNMWKTRGLTLIGKVTIIKYLILPKLVYKIMVISITISSCILKNIEQIFFGVLDGSDVVLENVLGLEDRFVKSLALVSTVLSLALASALLSLGCCPVLGSRTRYF